LNTPHFKKKKKNYFGVDPENKWGIDNLNLVSKFYQ